MPGHQVSAESAPILADLEDACRLLKISRGLLYKLMNSGEIASIHIGRRRYIPRAVLDDYVARKLATS